MKKSSAVFLFILIIFSSCSKDDDKPMNKVEKDPIVGTWQPVFDHVFYTNGEEEKEVFSECIRRSRVTFIEDGEIESVTYNDYNGECSLEDEKYSLGSKWVNLLEEKYRFDYTYIDENDEVRTDPIFPEKISFPEEGIMRIHHKPEVSYVEFSYSEYLRID